MKITHRSMQEIVQRLLEQMRNLEEGQEVFRMSQGQEILDAKKIEVEEAERVLEILSGDLKKALELKREIVEILVNVG